MTAPGQRSPRLLASSSASRAASLGAPRAWKPLPQVICLLFIFISIDCILAASVVQEPREWRGPLLAVALRAGQKPRLFCGLELLGVSWSCHYSLLVSSWRVLANYTRLAKWFLRAKCRWSNATHKASFLQTESMGIWPLQVCLGMIGRRHYKRP